MLKFLLATLVDRWRLGAANYKNWGILLGILYAAALALLAVYNLADTLYALLFALAMLTSLLGTWVDVPVNALAIRLLPESERIRAGVIRSVAASLAANIFHGQLRKSQSYGITPSLLPTLLALC
ncbi:hypothetical protein [Marinobacterium stanieri]|uniref:MFS transporter n=1 Tax=Marinobacterium stanieri TaxID=49186 RepID=A0A1N6X9E0_9GAMM|nr:hypothetical protein SAMN05421647_11330 [Marinobacterium stanieri]